MLPQNNSPTGFDEDTVTHTPEDPDTPTTEPATGTNASPACGLPDPFASDHDLNRLDTLTHPDPHAFLGAHDTGTGFTILRTLRPNAESVTAIIGGVEYPMTAQTDDLFVVAVPIEGLIDYRYRIDYPDGAGGTNQFVVADGYRFLPSIGETDTYLFGEGRHEELWTILGARHASYTTPDGEVTGTAFTVWAPNAHGIAVIGDFDWTGRTAPMRSLGSSGIWEVFLPDVGEGTQYKFRIHGADGVIREKADPMAQGTNVPPATASVVTRSYHTWTDDEWIARRAASSPNSEPMSVYEVHLASWREGLSYRELADQLGDYLIEKGFTHVEFLPVAEHPFGGSWGYQVTSYYAPTARFGTPDDFRYLVDHLHSLGIGVIVDWVPAHFPKDEWALARFDGTALYENADPMRGEQLDWGTLIFDFGRYEVRNFLVANALFWFAEFHIDGLRVDAVASMLYLDYSRPAGGWRPNIYGGRENLEAVQFLQETNATVAKHFPGVVTIAEESTAWPGVTRMTDLGGLGFSLKWNMGWMHDTLGYLGRDQVHRSFHHHEITFSMMYAWSENFVLPLSHDEVVHGKGTLWSRMPGNSFTKAAGVRVFLAYQWSHPGKQLLFMGQEFGQTGEWSEDRSLDWHQMTGWEGELHSGISALVTDLNRIYKASPALYSKDTEPSGYEWIDANDTANNVISFLRYGSDGSVVACLFNFSGSDRSNYRVGLPVAGEWLEVLNTDSAAYQGSGQGNLGSVVTDDTPWHGREVSAPVMLPANSAIWLAPAAAE
ncbi:1,4-alpha-glucan branching protein GlgB [Gordonia sp. VNQ95]|uniref:1,4-alpha-glucan branching protein GlgB n=1 Tax=Gordonia sp. VNQ95 TaxID=3156619 RepID=UPI0032B5F0EB